MLNAGIEVIVGVGLNKNFFSEKKKETQDLGVHSSPHRPVTVTAAQEGLHIVSRAQDLLLPGCLILPRIPVCYRHWLDSREP